MLIYSSHQIYREPTHSGAIGGYFTFGGNDIYAISNNHVMANLNNCKVNDPIYITGSTMKLGLLQNWVTINTELNYLDVALAKLDPAIQPGWHLPQGAVQPVDYEQSADGMKVYMMLPSGQVNWGTISNPKINTPVSFGLGGGIFPFTELIEITADGGGPFSSPGDSGCIVFSKDNYIIGLNMGTAGDTSKSYAVPFVNDDKGILAVYDLKIWLAHS